MGEGKRSFHVGEIEGHSGWGCGGVVAGGPERKIMDEQLGRMLVGRGCGVCSW